MPRTIVVRAVLSSGKKKKKKEIQQDYKSANPNEPTLAATLAKPKGVYPLSTLNKINLCENISSSCSCLKPIFVKDRKPGF